MNVFFFGFKRAFHGTLRLMRKPLRSFGLTSARFDLLYALRSPDQEGYATGPTQSELRKLLGVTASVVSRMLRSLETLGLVARERGGADRRTKRVTLTDRGKACVEQAYRALRHASCRLVNLALGVRRHAGKNRFSLPALLLEDFLGGLRAFCADSATLYYPWHPDD
jgi:DNA-binding MarR family transcriptional regulator